MVSAVVQNSGARAGTEVVQLYVRDLVGSVTRPVKELKGFQRITLQPGEQRTVRFDVPAGELGCIGLDMRYAVEPGAFKVWIGPDFDKRAGRAVRGTLVRHLATHYDPRRATGGPPRETQECVLFRLLRGHHGSLSAPLTQAIQVQHEHRRKHMTHAEVTYQRPTSTPTTGEITVADVRFEHLRDALGIGTAQPRDILDRRECA